MASWNEWIDFTDDQAEAFAKFMAQLVREGVTYQVNNLCGGWRVRLTGGY